MAETIENFLFAIATPFAPAAKGFLGNEKVNHSKTSCCCFPQPSNADALNNFWQAQRCSISRASQAFLLLTSWSRTLHGDCTASLARRGTDHHYSFALGKPARFSSGSVVQGDTFILCNINPAWPAHVHPWVLAGT